MEKAGEIDPHRPILTAGRATVGMRSGETNANPSWRTINGDATATMQHFHWDLRGVSVDVPSSGGIKANSVDPIVDLLSMAPDGARLDPGHLHPGNRIASVIGLQGGNLTARAVSTNMLGMMKEQDARAGSTEPQIPARSFANLITVYLSVPGIVEPGPGGQPMERGTLSLGLTTSAGRKQVTFAAGPDGAIICFSNLCECLPVPDAYDFEFAQYYELLSVATPERLIPFISHGGTQDCNDFCEATY